MKQQPFFTRSDGAFSLNIGGRELASRDMIVATILAIALIAFEIFNFDTTQFALESLLGGEKFLGIMWASILAIAFCSIDFAGLIRIFTPEKGADEPRIVWYLMGAWLLGATMNSVMTWWAVSLTLLNHDFGNEVLSREQLLRYVPIFVAALVLLTRILFIGAFTVAGERVVQQVAPQKSQRRPRQAGNANLQRPQQAPLRQAPVRARAASPSPRAAAPRPVPASRAATPPLSQAADDEISYHPLEEDVMPTPVKQQPQGNGFPRGNGTSSRIRNRPPMPNVRNQIHTHTPGRH